MGPYRRVCRVPHGPLVGSQVTDDSGCRSASDRATEGRDTASFRSYFVGCRNRGYCHFAFRVDIVNGTGMSEHINTMI